MTWKMTIIILTAVLAVAGLEALALMHGLNGKLFAGSMAAIAFLVALPISPDSVIGLVKRIVGKTLYKMLPIALAAGMYSGCDKLQINPESAIDCAACIVRCASVITASTELAQKCQDPEADECREVVSK